MARKQSRVPKDEISESDLEEHNLEVSDEPPEIDPYAVLNLDKTATSDQVKSAYRKAALKHHPDKAADEDKAAAHTKFQEIAFAYAILSDETRRKRYDVTGRTDESAEETDFDWINFYRAQFEDVVSEDKIAAFAKEYKHSDEERDDVLAAYEEVEGDMSMLYEHVMLSDMIEDEERFREIIDAAIKSKDVEAYDAYTKETAKAKKRRFNAAKKSGGKEAEEAEEMAKELGLKKQKSGKNGDISDLQALISQRQQGRGNIFAGLEAKYGQQSSKRARDEPSEEAFAKNEKKMKKAKAGRGK